MSRPRILMVDDEPDIRRLVRLLLDSEGYEVIEAGSVAEAVAHLKSAKVDAIVLDWMMPGVSGLDLLRNLRDSEQGGMPVVMLTGISEERLPEAVDAGADWIVTKPFDVEDLLEAMRSLLPRTSVPAGAKRGEHGPDTWIDLRS